MPSRPRDGEWAGGSDEEKEKELGSDDEWGDVYGGGGDEGPQVVVLKEGRHLSADEVKRERRRGTRPSYTLTNLLYSTVEETRVRLLTSLAAGKPSQSPEPESKKKDTDKDQPTKKVSQLPPKLQSSAKRKLVTKDTKDTDKNAEGENGDSGKKDGAGGKKKKKSDKKLLSFNEDE